MLIGYSLLLGSLLATTVSGLFPNRYSVHERRSRSPTGWTQLDSLPDPKAALRLTFALVPRNAESAEEQLLRVSDPRSSSYGQYWTAADVINMFSPDRQAVHAVIDWLLESGVGPQRIRSSNDGSLVSVNTTVQEAETLLKTRYYLFESGVGKSLQVHLACEEYSLPESLRRHIDFVGPTVHLGLGTKITTAEVAPRSAASPKLAGHARARAAAARRQAAGDQCSRFMTPDCLRKMYKIPTNNASHPNNTFGVYQQAWVSWLPGDLDGFFTMFAPQLKGSRPIMAPVDGGYWQDRFQAFPLNAEADLDFEYTMTLTAPQPVTNYQVGDISAQGNFNTLLAAFDEHYCNALNATIDGTYPDPVPGGYNSSDCGTLKPAKVVSLSYAWDEAALPPAYLRRQCLQFLKLGLQGVSVIVASADCGAAGQDCTCVDPATGEPNHSTSQGAFGPTSPAVCPYVTSVGGTKLPSTNSSWSDREVAYRRLSALNLTSSSGGGFSRVFPAPEYQRDATRRYLAAQGGALAPVADRFNPLGRGVPDVAAHAANFVTVIDGNVTTVFGTSASTPVFASVIALVNDARLRAGKGPVGFLNPVLYANPHVMNDVTEGSNHGCGVEHAFYAAEGWDPVTGLGTVNYERLKGLYLSLP
ncbi:peptidase S8/S53 domain-containing protein [Echria macrotheca]|uniref:Peptidase S8/S53 domain-containing protein n=1 Tax=Echria macrotheca TaxID=438768 RepID=A0AAJ0BHS8_9PEZI|nr:peptidase S8/S53 domain-containing protein [Echria macrotheca]